ncbi:MBL fold metallo-hydrolase [Achromobacter sp. UMC71]|uniref:MBL fold metallo-hydrolase n=1 Tax=Achromobacter sp. UMC71 TaxID=1862320 RepID=UPI001601F535|nr:MBL fold metallo-hydrolase [Achromobacter sp. UMC71]MBB1626413.1 MBL fold hydrolase [Achromobacter sp. UMC71]
MYQIDILIQGYPGRAVCHGGLGWSTSTLLRSAGRKILVDVGAFGVRHQLAKHLQACDVAPADITDVVLTHAHYDHAVNFTLFPNATVWIGQQELEWAAAQPPGFNPLPELYVQELNRQARVHRIHDGDTFLPGITAIASPGHTPGHLLFYVDDPRQAVLFTGDAAKNRAELLSGQVADTADAAASHASLQRIWAWWRKRPGTLLVPGHDLGMTLDDSGAPVYVGERRAAINAWFGEDLQPTRIDLCCGGTAGRHRV